MYPMSFTICGLMQLRASARERKVRVKPTTEKVAVDPVQR
jgi:hypothetical protein